MAQAYNAIANGGVEHRPYVVQGDEKPGKRVLATATANSVAKMLQGVLSAGGTASEAAIPGYTLAGKTGTAQKPDPINGGYSKDKYVASFIGFAPATKPRLEVAVMVDEPKGAIFGGVVAAPAFQKILQFALPYLRVPPR
jgi:cell division protein FtsI/penicillin-binding protein 2